MTYTLAKFQLGKNGVNSGTIEALALSFKNHKQVRISLLKSSGRDRNSKNQIALDIAAQLEKKTGLRFTFKIIGFTIIMNRHSLS